MAKMSARTSVRVGESSDTRAQVESVVCDQCQDLCWSVQIWIHDIAGTGAKACVLHRDHLSRQSSALMALGTFVMGAARGIQGREERAWMIEHQGTLWV